MSDNNGSSDFEDDQEADSDAKRSQRQPIGFFNARDNTPDEIFEAITAALKAGKLIN